MVAVRDDLRLALDRASFAEALGIEPDPWQRDLPRSSSGRVLLNCSRQSGKSTMSAVIALHRALYRPGCLVLILAPSERQAKELFSKVTGFYRDLHGAAPAASDRKMGMILTNGSRIEALPGSEKTIRGFSGVDLLILDEAARVDDALYHAIRPMLAVSGGELMLLSTPFGKRGVFYEAWTGSEDWDRYEVPADEIPRITEEFLEEERRALPSWVFRQEYECSFEETDDQVFTTEMIDAAVSADVEPLNLERLAVQMGAVARCVYERILRRHAQEDRRGQATGDVHHRSGPHLRRGRLVRQALRRDRPRGPLAGPEEAPRFEAEDG